MRESSCLLRSAEIAQDLRKFSAVILKVCSRPLHAAERGER